MLFIRACDAALFLSFNAALRLFRSLMRVMIVYRSPPRSVLPTPKSSIAGATTHLLLLAHPGRPSGKVAVTLLDFTLLLCLTLLTLALLLTLCSFARVVPRLQEFLLLLLFQAVLVELHIC